jgi:hypothetical protein
MPTPTLDGAEAVRLASTLIEITSSVTHGAETIDIFTDLALRCVELLPVSAAGILLRDASGRLQVIGASNPSAHLLDLFQVQNHEGPCLECSRTGEPISDESLSADGPWPGFAELAHENGFSAAYALPLRSRDLTVGALNLFASTRLSEGQLVVAQALADSATLSLLQVDPTAELHIIIRRIHIAVESRNTIEQAQGMIAQRFALDVEAAYSRLRDVSEEAQMSMYAVAHAVVTRDSNSPASRLL